VRTELLELNRLCTETGETIGRAPAAIVVQWYCARIVAQALVIGMVAIAEALEARS
jgi:hypothetical protein